MNHKGNGVKEALLREPIEFYTGATGLLSGTICAALPNALMMTPEVGYASAAILAYYAYKEFDTALYITRYQRNLHQQSLFVLTSDQIPCSNKHLYLGKGFDWEQKHTQRLVDIKDPRHEKYTQPPRRKKWARRKEIEWEYTWGLRNVAALFGKDSIFNPFRPIPNLGGLTYIHGLEPDELDQYCDLGERNGHMVVYGTTRCGKSRFAEVLITQDIRRNDGAVITIDPKGDQGLMRRMYVEAKRTGRKFICLHLGFPAISARYNGVGSFARISEVASRATNPLASEGNSQAFKEFAWRFTNNIAQALTAMGIKPTYDSLQKHIMDMDSLFINYGHHFLQLNGAEGWEVKLKAKKEDARGKPRHRSTESWAMERILLEMKTADSVINGLISAVRYEKTYFDKLTASLLPFLEKITSGDLLELLSPDYNDVDDPREIFDWMQVIRGDYVVYVGLDAMTNQDVSAAVGNAMFSDLVSTSGYLYKYGMEDGFSVGRANILPKVYLHADEFNELAGKEFKPLLNKCGGSGIMVTAYTQTKADLASRLGSEIDAEVLEGNFNTMVMMRVKGKATAELLTDQLEEVPVINAMQISGAKDNDDIFSSTHFNASNDDRTDQKTTPMITPETVIKLPKGHAFALVNGGHLKKLRFPMIDDTKDPEMPESLQKLYNEMATKYVTSDNWWQDINSTLVAPQFDDKEVSVNHYAEQAMWIGEQAAEQVGLYGQH